MIFTCLTVIVLCIATGIKIGQRQVKKENVKPKVECLINFNYKKGENIDRMVFFYFQKVFL